MKVCLLIILLLLSSVAFAQTNDSLRAYKFDEFGKLQESEWKERLDRFSEMEVAFPDSTLHIIVYAQIGENRTSISELKRLYRGYLNKVKEVGSVYIDLGGWRSSQTTELWVVPKYAHYPKPTPDEKFKAEIYSEFGEATDEEVKNEMVEYVMALVNSTNDTGYIINYGTPESVAKRERQIEKSTRMCFDRSRITFVNVGDIGKLKTVFWLIPSGAEVPTP